jgi:hypothetical protein
MKARLALACVAFAAITGSAAADEVRPILAMKFTSIQMVEQAGAGALRISLYRMEDRVMILVQDPIVCGQRPINPTSELQGNQLRLRYDLTKALAEASGPSCTAHSIFTIDGVLSRDLEIAFARGKTTFIVAGMARCSESQPTVDTWNCLPSF